MKINLRQILLIAFIFFISAIFNLISAGGFTPAPPSRPPGGGGGGGLGPGGRPTNPIDLYQIALFIFAIVLITYFYKKIKLSKV